MDPAQQDQPRRAVRVAFFGGSFDPPHVGHLAVARAARQALRLDRVLFAPVGAQPLKPLGATAAFDDRLAMTRLAVGEEQGFEVSLIDAPRVNAASRDPGRPNYTIDTLATLRAVLPETAELFCLVGADSFLNLRHWHRPAEIPFAAEMIVASRPGQSLEDLAGALPDGLSLQPVKAMEIDGIALREYSICDGSHKPASFYVLPGLHVDISATEIRAQVNAAAHGLIVQDELLPAPVAEYIREWGLYR
jgi:nicotinate-nucleotide adenylyltransferase